MSHSVRVAFVHHFYPHYRLPVMRYLDADPELQCTFLGDDHEFEGRIKPAAIPAGMRFVHARARRVVGPVMWQSEVIRAARSPRFDAIVLHGVAYWASMWAAAAVGRIAGKRVFLWGHGYLYPPKGLKGVLRRAFYALPHAHLLYGHYAKEFARRRGWPDDRLHVIHNGLDQDELEHSAANLGSDHGASLRLQLFGDPDVRVITCPTRLVRIRRLDLLLEASAILRGRGLPVCLLFIGSGPERRSLAIQAAECGVSVHFEGECYDERRIASLLRAAHIAAAPGCVGLSALHCMAHGLPVVTHDELRHQMPEHEAIIPGRTGSLFRRGDPHSLADALEQWLRDPARLDAAAHECRTIVRRFWNARTQAQAISRALRGADADDLWQLRDLPRSAR